MKKYIPICGTFKTIAIENAKELICALGKTQKCHALRSCLRLPPYKIYKTRVCHVPPPGYGQISQNSTYRSLDFYGGLIPKNRIYSKKFLFLMIIG